MLIYGYELTSEWINCRVGLCAEARKDHRRYLLTKYLTVSAPVNNGALSAATMEYKNRAFHELVEARTKLNSLIRSIACNDIRIAFVAEEFVHDYHFFEAVEIAQDAIPFANAMSVFGELSVNEKQYLMRITAAVLSSIHQKGIVHGDLNLYNLCLMRMPYDGTYDIRIQELEHGFLSGTNPVDKLPSLQFASPELAAFTNAAEDCAEPAKPITVKTDIFSLGLIYHYCLTGEFPIPETLPEPLQKRKNQGKTVYPWAVLNSGCRLRLSPRIEEPHVASLISRMLCVDPDERPTAYEVMCSI